MKSYPDVSGVLHRLEFANTKEKDKYVIYKKNASERIRQKIIEGNNPKKIIKEIKKFMSNKNKGE